MCAEASQRGRLTSPRCESPRGPLVSVCAMTTLTPGRICKEDPHQRQHSLALAPGPNGRRPTSQGQGSKANVNLTLSFSTSKRLRQTNTNRTPGLLPMSLAQAGSWTS